MYTDFEFRSVVKIVMQSLKNINLVLSKYELYLVIFQTEFYSIARHNILKLIKSMYLYYNC